MTGDLAYGLALDAGGLIAFERNDRRIVQLVETALKLGLQIIITAGVIGQVWRDGRKQARLSRLLATRGVRIEPLTDEDARRAGQLCGVTHTADVIDAAVVISARRRLVKIVTSDPDDMTRLDSSLELIVV